ncbi:RpiB/LacA/LacB family sugar-phosphate isomerase [Patescibacteria group bacterium]|nr:RpiB/LacA/LacB family sugar-phosphate isomerase [Patescibacteria group bacterium]MBU1448725.1 RpiB/LacA/LacB family sugar-phosphate isomerase [Patescibacteria group bacterium]MBU2613431.1 RpiB/LacA/LacB family sugar-phosphate isomerase [Patescibacteria group bacterium]
MSMQTIVMGADHAGFALKEAVKVHLIRRGAEVRDLSPRFTASDDYPAIGRKVATAVAKDRNARGILVCGSGVGVAIAANRVRGARAVDGHTPTKTKLAREHNDVNILTLSGWSMKPAAAAKLVDVFLSTPASTAARHRRRVKQLG